MTVGRCAQLPLFTRTAAPVYEPPPKPAPAPLPEYPTPEALALRARILAALPGTFAAVARGANCTVNKALAVLGLLAHRGAVIFDPQTAIYRKA